MPEAESLAAEIETHEALAKLAVECSDWAKLQEQELAIDRLRVRLAQLAEQSAAPGLPLDTH